MSIKRQKFLICTSKVLDAIFLSLKVFSPDNISRIQGNDTYQVNNLIQQLRKKTSMDQLYSEYSSKKSTGGTKMFRCSM